MKLRRQPEDFRVTELSGVLPQPEGRFGLYRLEKRGLATRDAVRAIQRAWRLPGRAIAYGGLKDRHAVTEQHVSVQGGPPTGLELPGVRLTYLGRLDRAFGPHDLLGNRFHLVLRDMGADEVRAARDALASLAEDGVPNYFDDQRFGSVTREGKHVAEAWVREDYEGALRRAFVDANEHDRPGQRALKRLLAERWGDWAGLRAALPGGQAALLVAHLAEHPGDFAGALGLVPHDLRSLWLAAFQSALWNELLAAEVREATEPAELVTLEGRAGPLPFWRRLTPGSRERLATLELPLPSSRTELAPGPLAERVASVLAAHGLALADLHVRRPKDSFFSKGWRPAVLRPTGLSVEVGADLLYPGRQAVTLAFDLPRGAYATVIVKRLTAVARATAGPSGGPAAPPPRTRRKQRLGRREREARKAGGAPGPTGQPGQPG
ncbi:MAG: tRNA pseudouridine(13) synthase TruD [Planctomycetia bacterium]